MTAHRNSIQPVNVFPATVIAVSRPTTQPVIGRKTSAERTAEAIRPLYIAHMILLSLPRRTKNVPITVVMMQAPQIASG
jgi:hypothetical protein